MRASRTSDTMTGLAGERAAVLQVFLNYRREDAAGYAGHLFDELAGLGRYDVFMDIEKIGAGLPFKEAINSALSSCDVFVSLIGPRWLDAEDSAGRRRLENPNDLVRLEIEGALARDGVRVVPVLLQGADVPTADALPESLLGLIERNALELSDKRWEYDVEQLVLALETIAAKKAGQAGEAEREAERLKEEAARLEEERRREEERKRRELAAAQAAELEAERLRRKREERGLSRRAKLLLASLAGAAVLGVGVVAAIALGGEDEPGPTTEVQPATTSPTTPTEVDEPVGDPLASVGVPFPFDATGGTGGQPPVRLTFDEAGRVPDTIPEEAGFTGLMTNGTAPVSELFDPDKVVVEDGLLKILAGTGDPIQRRNTQQNAFQFGLGPQEGPFTVHVRLPDPFADVTEVVNFQSMGLFIGTGDQDDYVKLVAGSQGVELLREVQGVRSARKRELDLPGPAAVDLYLTVDPAAPNVAAWFTTSEPGPTTWVDAPPELRFPRLRIPDSWFTDPESGLAVGVISTTGLPGEPFWAAWDLLEVTPG